MKLEVTLNPQDWHDLLIAIVALLAAITGLINSYNRNVTHQQVQKNTSRLDEIEAGNGTPPVSAS